MTGAAFSQVFRPERGRQLGVTQSNTTDAHAIAMQTNATGSSFITGNAPARVPRVRNQPGPERLRLNGNNISRHAGLNLPANTTGRVSLRRTALGPDRRHMQLRTAHAHPPRGGFSLIELMIVRWPSRPSVRLAVPLHHLHSAVAPYRGQDALLDLAHGKSVFSAPTPGPIQPARNLGYTVSAGHPVGTATTS